MNQIPTLTAILLLSWLAEAITEYIARPWLKAPLGPRSSGAAAAASPKDAGDEEPNKPPALRYAALGFGVILAVAYQADLLALVGLVSPWSPYVGYILTGLIIGRGSNFIHDLADRWLAPSTIVGSYVK
jgi:hypothetical protein